MNVSQLVVECLRALGVRRIFGYLGDPSVELLEAARRAAARDDRDQRRRLAQASRRPGLEDLCAAQHADDQRALVDGLLAASMSCEA